MGVLVILCGLPFSGKTTVARSLAERSGCAVVSLDEINEERGVGHGGQGLGDDVWAETQRIAIERVESLMREGRERIVVDDTCCLRFLRDEYRRAAERHGYEHGVVFLDVSERVLRERLREAARSGERPTMTDDVFEGCLARFERPEEDEACIVISPDDDAPSVLASMLAPPAAP